MILFVISYGYMQEVLAGGLPHAFGRPYQLRGYWQFDKSWMLLILWATQNAFHIQNILYIEARSCICRVSAKCHLRVLGWMGRGYSQDTGQRESVNPLLSVNASDNGELGLLSLWWFVWLMFCEIFAALFHREGAAGRWTNPLEHNASNQHNILHLTFRAKFLDETNNFVLNLSINSISTWSIKRRVNIKPGGFPTLYYCFRMPTVLRYLCYNTLPR